MNHEESLQQGTDFNKKYCKVCHIDYEDEGDGCPSCNPKLTYYVEVGVASGEDDWEFKECFCNECPSDGYWRKDEAVAHAKMIAKRQGETYGDACVRVIDSQGTEVDG